MSNPPDPKACSERADSLSVSDLLDVSDPATDESRRPPRRKERARVKASKRQREAVAETPDIESAEAQSGAAAAQVKLPANCSIRDCGALKLNLSAVLSAPEPVSIDVSSLERIDTAAIQLLCAFVRDRRGQKLEVVWSGKSTAFTEAARLLGVETVLGVEKAAST